MLSVLRREEKYVMKLTEASYFSDNFSKLLMNDKYSCNGAYCVRSLYFDTADDKDFHDKITEQNCRRKIRLRIYDPGDQTAKLEMKQKENIYQKKRSLTVSRLDACALIEGNHSVLLKYPEPFAAELFAVMSTECYRPKTIIEYRRRAFMAKENNIRITFDSQIQATESSVDLFSAHLPLYPVMDLGQVVMEVKYDKFMLSYISDIISRVEKRSVSSSKYCMGRSVGYPLRTE